MAKTKSRTTRQKKAENKNGSMLEEFFIDSLKDIYWAEKALTKALPRMSKSTTSNELKTVFDQHLEVTRKQISRLDQVFEKLGKRAQGKKCDAMEGLIAESESIIKETENDSYTRDAALIIAAQKVEHYEIASYGGLVQLAQTMGKKGIANLLAATLKEEKKADERLTKVAEKNINIEASEEPAKKKQGIFGLFV
ncbi:MAG TPA: ferritin-like domain-containing protein [Ohtaekwangia sp.]|nr:ferritin-like domain-containing protein [Ohtaekwangia sp.]